MEIWKNIPNYPGYRASSLGNIRSYWTKGKYPCISKIFHLRKPTLNRGYFVVNVTNNQKQQRAILVHRLILMAFKGVSKKAYGLHRNDIHTDNRIENLYWGSQKQNIKDMWANGHGLFGEKCPWAKLNNQQIEEIKNKYNLGIGVVALGREYKVSHSLISMILSGRRWKPVSTQNV